jgi:hypothetical protein
MSEKQEKEIESIRARNILIKLSDADVEKLFEKAGRVGLTVSELLERFIGDLVDGTYSNGSDERMYANEWFDRCWFSMGLGNIIFLQWLIAIDYIEETINDWKDLQDLKADLEDEKNQEEPDEELAEDYKVDIASFEENLNNLFVDYKKQARAIKNSTLESEMEKVIKWHEEKQKLKGNGTGSV